MPFATSYVNGRTLRDAAQGLAVNLDTDTIRAALFADAITGQDKNAVETYGAGAFAANEVSSAGYTAGGQALANPTTTTPAAGVWRFRETTAPTMVWSGVTFTARGVVVYDFTAASRVLCAINFGADQAVVAGTFTITWDPVNFIFSATY